MNQERRMAAASAAALAGTAALLSGLALSQYGAASLDCGADCADAYSTPWATILGVPVALWGVMYFSALAAWIFLAMGRPGVSRGEFYGTLFVSGLGACVSLTYFGLMYFGAHWCPLCLATHVVNFAMLPFIWATKPSGDEGMVPVDWRLVTAVAAMTVTGELAAWFGWHSALLQGERQQLVAALAQAEARRVPATAIAVPTTSANDRQDTVADAQSGRQALVAATQSPSATLEIFTDLMCPNCRKFEERLLNELVPTFNGRLAVELRHFPLCSQCNSGATDLHPWACEAAYLVEAAREQRGVEGVLAVLHEIDPRRATAFSEPELHSLAKTCGLDPQRLMQDMQGDPVRNRVLKDIERGKSLGLRATPSLLLDGQPISSSSWQESTFWQELAANLLTQPPTVVAAAATPEKTIAAKPVIAATPQRRPARSESAAMTEQQQATAQSLLAQHDANEDGVLDPAEWKTLYRDGKRFDSNEDQRISIEELAASIVTQTPAKGRSDSAAAEGKVPATPATATAPAKPKPESMRISTIFPGDELHLAGKTLDGETFDIAQWRGKPVLVVFWASWCGHCVDETAELLRIYRTYHDSGLEIVGISSDQNHDLLRQFIEQNDLPWTQLVSNEPAQSGVRNPWAVAYNVRGLPAVFLVGAEGTVKDVHLRGRDLELAVSRELAVEPVAEDVAAQAVAGIKANLTPPSTTADAPRPMQLGDPVQVAGPTVDGGRFDLADHRGKVVLVAFWASWCPHCKKELPKILDVYEKYKDRGLEVVGVSLDRKLEDLQKYLGEKPLPWPTIYRDVDGLRGFQSPLAYWYKVSGVPAVFVIDQEGRLASLKPRGPAIESEIARLLGEAPTETITAAADQKPPTETPAVDPEAAVEMPDKPEPNSASNSGVVTDAKRIQQVAEILIQKYDDNKDGVLVHNEWIHAGGDLGVFDKDSNGMLTQKELAAAVLLTQKYKLLKSSKKALSQSTTPGTTAAAK